MIFNHKILLNVEPTPDCPAACSMCPRDQIKDKGFMKVETFEKILKQVDSSFVWELDLAGRGEPTIHPEFATFGEMMARRGFVSGVVTTAVAMTDRNIDAARNHFDRIRLSVSSYRKDVFDKVHIGLNHKKIWSNIASLAAAAADKTIVHLVGGPVIYDALPETVAHLRQLGFTRIHLFPLWNRGGAFAAPQDNLRRQQIMRDLNLPASESEYWSGTGKLKYLANAAASRIVNSKFCAVGNSSLSIAHDGKILGCYQDFGHTSIIGHLDSHPLSEIMAGRTRQVGNMKICNGCNANVAAMFKGKSRVIPIKSAQA